MQESQLTKQELQQDISPIIRKLIDRNKGEMSYSTLQSNLKKTYHEFGNYNSFLLKLKNKQPWTLYEIVCICNFFDCYPSEFLEEAGY